MIAHSFQTTRHRTAGPINGPIDGDVDVGFDIFDDQARRARKPDPNPAAVFLATVWISLDEQTDRNLAQVGIGPAERETQTSLDVLAQVLGQIQILGLDVDLHEVFP